MVYQFMDTTTNQEQDKQPNQQETTRPWQLFINGMSNTQGVGASIILIRPNNMEIAYALKFNFKVTNNEVEYDALLAGLGMSLVFGVNHLEIKGDSQLIVNQVNGQFQSRGENIQACLDKV